MRNVNFLIIFLYSIIQIGHAQNLEFQNFPIPESLSKFSAKEVLDLYNKVEPINSNSGRSDIDSARVLAKIYLSMSLKANDSLGIGRGYLILGRLTPVDTTYLNKSIEFTKPLLNGDYPTLTYIRKFIYYFQHGYYRKANNSLLSAMSYSSGAENEFFIKSSLNKLEASWGNNLNAVEGLIEEQKIIRSLSFNDIQMKLYNGDFRNELLTDNFYSIAEAHYRLNDYTLANLYLDSVQLYGTK